MAKILYVEDSETSRTHVIHALDGSGHVVIEAENGLRGLEQLEAHKDINLILCDQNMPIMDGLTMCSKIHENSELNHIPILMITTEHSPELKAKGKSLGVKGWIVKPFSGDKIVIGINKILERFGR